MMDMKLTYKDTGGYQTSIVIEDNWHETWPIMMDVKDSLSETTVEFTVDLAKQLIRMLQKAVDFYEGE